MTGSSTGKLFKVSTWGESHGEALGCVIEGVPSKIKITVPQNQFIATKSKSKQGFTK